MTICAFPNEHHIVNDHPFSFSVPLGTSSMSAHSISHGRNTHTHTVLQPPSNIHNCGQSTDACLEVSSMWCLNVDWHLPGISCPAIWPGREGDEGEGIWNIGCLYNSWIVYSLPSLLCCVSVNICYMCMCLCLILHHATCGGIFLDASQYLYF